MLNLFTTEYLMVQNQIEIENEAKLAWKWLNQSGRNKTQKVKIIVQASPVVACCQPACC